MEAFKNRREAGKLLSEALEKYSQRPETVVFGLPRGGIEVAYEIALALDAPLEPFIVRKLGAPGQEELAMGAIASGGVCILNSKVSEMLALKKNDIDPVVQKERRELQRRENLYRGHERAPVLSGRQVIVVDDGLATGSTMEAAVTAIREQRPAHITLAVPVAPPETCRHFMQQVDEIVCLRQPPMFSSVGEWYAEFPQTTDEQVRTLLEKARQRRILNGVVKNEGP